MDNKITFKDFIKVDLRLIIIEVNSFPQAIRAAYRLIDFLGLGVKKSFA